MGKLAMCTLDINDDTLDIRITDIQRISKVPDTVKALAKKMCNGRRLNKSGLPSVQYLGADRIQIVGAIQYGEIAFVEFEGKWSSIVKEDSLICIKAYREDATYEELMEGEQDYIDELHEKYPNGYTVGGESTEESPVED